MSKIQDEIAAAKAGKRAKVKLTGMFRAAVFSFCRQTLTMLIVWRSKK